MGQEIWKFTKKSGKSQENGIDISMKASFQILTGRKFHRLWPVETLGIILQYTGGCNGFIFELQ